MQWRLVLTLAAVIGMTSNAAHAARAFTIDDLVRLERISDPQLSPDGAHLAYQVRQTDYEANKGVNGIWLMEVAKPNSGKQITDSGKGATTPRWSGDGQSIYFLSNDSGSSQVWKTSLDGRTKTQVTDLPLDVGSYKLVPGGKQLIVSMEVFPDCNDLACTKKRMDEKTASKKSGVLYDQLFIRH